MNPRKLEEIPDSEKAELYRVAHMYYDLGMLQPEIAEKLYLSRSKVSRMLKEAREVGIVRITVNKIFYRNKELEALMIRTFGLRDAVVVACYDEISEDTLAVICGFAADYISQRISGSFTFGITNGNTVSLVVKSLKKLHPCSLTSLQLVGATNAAYQSAESQTLVNRVSGVYEGTAHFLNAPLYIDDLYAKNVLIMDPSLRSVFHEMTHCSMVLTGIGSFGSGLGERPYWQSYMLPRHFIELEKEHAAGSICTQFFDLDGKPVKSEWNAKCIAMPLTDIRSCSNVVAVAQGTSKSRAILGALRGHYPNVLVTDDKTALDVLRLNEKL